MTRNNTKARGGVACLTIQTQVLEAAVGKVVLHDGHERGHLTEEQHFVVCGPQLRQDSIQHLELPRCPVQVEAVAQVGGEGDEGGSVFL